MSKQIFSGKGFLSSGFLNLTPSEAYAEARDSGAVIMDVREPDIIGAKRFDVPNVLYFPLSKIKADTNDIPANIPLILADSAGLRSREAMAILQMAGFTSIANMAGGLVEWDRDGLPLIINYDEQLSGACICQLHRVSRIKR